MTLQDYLNYYSGLLIVQYNGLPNATNTVQCFANCSLADGLPMQLQTAFNLNTAVGNQLSIIGKLVGIPRNVQGLDLTHVFFEMTRYSGGTSTAGFGRYASNPYPTALFKRYFTNASYVMSDFEMLNLIKLKILFNTQSTSLSNLVSGMYSIFGNSVQVVDQGGYFGIDNNTVLMLHLDNNVTDSEFTPKTVTNNSVIFSNSVYKFGGYSGYFGGSGDYLSVPVSNDWYFNNAFTIDGWINYSALPSAASFGALVSQSEALGTGDRYWVFGNYNGTNLSFVMRNQSYGSQGVSASWIPSLNTWYHIAVVYDGYSTMYLFINGIIVAQGTYNLTSTYNQAASLLVGAFQQYNTTPQAFNGYVDELRISKGTARWTSNFTPPTAPYSAPNPLNLTINVSNPYHNVFAIASYLNFVPRGLGIAINYNYI